MLIGVGDRAERGKMSPRTVPFYNAVHRVHGPVILLAISLVVGPRWTYGSLLWLAHICIDRALGFRLRSADGTIKP